jgi:MFS family permease
VNDSSTAQRPNAALIRLGVVAFTWFAAWGISSVVISWIGTKQLQLSGRPFSWIQMSPQLPPLVLLMVGGAIADRVDPRRLIQAVHLGTLVPVALFAGAVIAGAVSLPLLVGYGLCLGVGSAFAAPPRDGLLSHVAGSNLMAAVTALTIAQFGGQAAGSLGGGRAEALGIPAMLALQAALLAIGAAAARGLPRIERASAAPRPGAWLEGARTVARTPALRVPVGLTTAIGVFFMGPFIVGFPIIVRDFYQGGAAELGWILATFPLGTILGSLAIRARGGIARKGRAMLLAMTNGALNLTLLSAGLPYWGFLLCALAWGTGGAVFINSSRALVQQTAPPEQRGRILAVYQLGFVGSGPIGMALTGALVDAFDPLTALRICAACMALVIASAAAFSSARKL